MTNKNWKIIQKEPVTIVPAVLHDTSRIVQTFYDLTRYTSPYGTETDVYGDVLTELGFTWNNWGFSAEVGTPAQQRVVLAAHLDDVSRDHTKVKLTYTDEKETSVFNNANEILGADDKTGVALLIYMYCQGVPGTYILFFGEECGCIGSNEWIKGVEHGQYDAMISFDRRGYDSVITHQCSNRTASDEFANALAEQINGQHTGLHFQPDDGGVFTDSNVARFKIPECTNLSVGYDGAHSAKESQDMEFLEMLGDALLHVDWSALPIKRDPQVIDRKSYTYSGKYSSASWDDDGYEDYWDEKDRAKRRLSTALEQIKNKTMTLAELKKDSWRMERDLAEFFYLMAINNPDFTTTLTHLIDGDPAETHVDTIEDLLNKALEDNV